MKSFWRSERGQGLVEFALVLPIFLAIVFFIIDAGWVTSQKTAFDQGYMYSSWEISAGQIGDSDPLETSPSRAAYTGARVSDALMETMRGSNLWGVLPENVSISNAEAVFYNEEEAYKVPGRTAGDAVPALNRTRYMNLSADIRYDIYPLTVFGQLIFGNHITMEKEIQCTRVVASQHRSE